VFFPGVGHSGLTRKDFLPEKLVKEFIESIACLIPFACLIWCVLNKKRNKNKWLCFLSLGLFV
jgi:hypothetical protein